VCQHREGDAAGRGPDEKEVVGGDGCILGDGVGVPRRRELDSAVPDSDVEPHWLDSASWNGGYIIGVGSIASSATPKLLLPGRASKLIWTTPPALFLGRWKFPSRRRPRSPYSNRSGRNPTRWASTSCRSLGAVGPLESNRPASGGSSPAPLRPAVGDRAVRGGEPLVARWSGCRPGYSVVLSAHGAEAAGEGAITSQG
jgi:hypothetical protein